MELWQNADNQTIIALSDLHQDSISSTVTFRHKEEVLALAKKLNAYSIFEDIGWYSGNNKEILTALELTRRDAWFIGKVGWLIPSCIENVCSIKTASPLFDITRQAKAQGIDCESIEFRFAGQWGFAGYKIPIREILKEVQAKIEQISHYNDGGSTQEVIDSLMSMYFERNQDLLEYLEQFSANETLYSLPQEKIFRMIDYAQILIDIEIIHALHKQLELGRQNLIVYAGGDHIADLHDALVYMGFELKASQGSIIKNEFIDYSDAQIRELIENALSIPKAYDQLLAQ
jgi:hypothetical protein